MPLNQEQYQTAAYPIKSYSHELHVCFYFPSRHLVRLFQSRGQVVTYPPHGLQRRLVEVRGLSVHHLDHHDAQRPHIHLNTQQNVQNIQEGRLRRRCDGPRRRVHLGPVG